MSTPASEAQKAGDRAALMAWWAGDRKSPFILPFAGRDYCVCYLFFTTLAEKCGLSVKTSLCWLAERVPFSNLKIRLYRLAGAKIGKDAFISAGVVIDPLYPELVELGDGCLLGMGALLLCHEYTARESRLGCVRIGRKTVIGARAVVRAGVTIGNHCTVGACGFVNRDVPDGMTAVGVPARLLKPGGEE